MSFAPFRAIHWLNGGGGSDGVLGQRAGSGSIDSFRLKGWNDCYGISPSKVNITL